MQYLKNSLVAAALSVAALAQAGVVVAPTTATSSVAGLFGPATGTINGSGLSAAYTAGVTDFDAFVATTKTSSAGCCSSIFIPSPADTLTRLTYGFGAATSIGSIAVWNNNISNTGGIDAISGFELFADNDADFSNGTSGSLGQFSMSAVTDYLARPADVFSFTETTTSFVHFQITGTQAGRRTGINEVLFEAGGGNAVPEPGSLALVGLGLAFAAVRARRR